jgi:ubiquinone/menaquinone biosynthesis C-methylase UbiE
MSIFEYLIGQSIKPNGQIGRLMLKMMNTAHKRIFTFGIENINVSDDCKLLDLGFGGGMALNLFSKKFNRIKLFGIDFSEEALKIGTKNNRKDIACGKITLLQADIEKIPFSDYYFDIITAFQTHYHWHDLDSKMQEIYRVLNRNGQLVIVAEKYKINHHMEKYKTENELKELFIKTGLRRNEYKETKYNILIKGFK